MTRRGPSQHVRGSWRGFFALHRGEDFAVIADALRAVRPQCAVELGTAAGGFSAFLADTLAEWGGHVLTVDVKADSVPPEEGYENSTVKRLLETTPNLTFLEADVLTRVDSAVKAWISEPGAFLYCDNGAKMQEMEMYAPLLGPGGLLGCHDYGSEVDPDFAEELTQQLGFVPFRHAEFEALAHPGYPISMTRLWWRA